MPLSSATKVAALVWMQCANAALAATALDVALLRKVAEQHRTNVMKIATWRGKAAIKQRTSSNTEQTEGRYAVEFVFDRKASAKRWAWRDLEKRVTRNGRHQAAPLGMRNVMVKDGAWYELALANVSAANRRRLYIYRVQARSPQHLGNDFDPLYYLQCDGKDVYTLLMQFAAAPASVVVKREGSKVVVEQRTLGALARYTFDRGCGASLVGYWRRSLGRRYNWTADFEPVAGVFVPKHATIKQSAAAGAGSVTVERDVVFTGHVLNQPVPASEFTHAKLGLRVGDVVMDQRRGRAHTQRVANLGAPRAVVRAASSVYRVGFSAVRRGQYETGLKSLLDALTAPGSSFSASEWARAYYSAGFAYDRLGRRGRAIEMYELALLWEPKGSPLYKALQAAQVAPPSRYLYTGRSRIVRRRPPQGPVDLFEDERRVTFMNGGQRVVFRFMVPDGRFDNMTPEQKQRLADEQLQAIQQGAEGEPLWRAIETLGVLKDRRALPHLHRLLHEEGRIVRGRQCWVACRALVRIADRSSIPHFISVLNHRITNVRAGASYGLHKLTGQHFRTPAEWQRWWAQQRGANANQAPEALRLRIETLRQRRAEQAGR